MEKRMDKNELLKLIETLKIDKEEFWVLSSGALVLRSIYPDAGDLDIAVTNKGFMELEKKYHLKQKENGSFIVTDNIECICIKEKEELKYQLEKVGEYYVQNIHEYFEYLNNSEREKDKLRIPLVKEYLKQNSN